MPTQFSGNKNRIIVSNNEVQNFIKMFPCSGLDSSRSYWFEFDNDGNLIDHDVPEHSDGLGARVLADDCHSFRFFDSDPDWSET